VLTDYSLVSLVIRSWKRITEYMLDTVTTRFRWRLESAQFMEFDASLFPSLNTTFV
jgi:hypothetical protein